MKNLKYTMGLSEACAADVELVGGKNASLGEMLQNITRLGVQIPGGFIVTVKAYYDFITYNNFAEKIKTIVNATDINDIQQLAACGSNVRNLIRSGEFPKTMKAEIIDAYLKL